MFNEAIGEPKYCDHCLVPLQCQQTICILSEFELFIALCPKVCNANKFAYEFEDSLAILEMPTAQFKLAAEDFYSDLRSSIASVAAPMFYDVRYPAATPLEEMPNHICYLDPIKDNDLDRNMT